MHNAEVQCIRCRKGPDAWRGKFNSELAVEKARFTAEAAVSPCPETAAPSWALELSVFPCSGGSSLVLLDVRGVSACSTHTQHWTHSTEHLVRE